MSCETCKHLRENSVRNLIMSEDGITQSWIALHVQDEGRNQGGVCNIAGPMHLLYRTQE